VVSQEMHPFIDNQSFLGHKEHLRPTFARSKDFLCSAKAAGVFRALK
jgi:hypothetical protein